MFSKNIFQILTKTFLLKKANVKKALSMNVTINLWIFFFLYPEVEKFNSVFCFKLFLFKILLNKLYHLSRKRRYYKYLSNFVMLEKKFQKNVQCFNIYKKTKYEGNIRYRKFN